MPDQTLVIQGSIDTHCHTIPMIRKGLDAETLLRNTRSAGIRAIVDVGLSPDDLAERRSALGQFNWISYTSGLHPSEIDRKDRAGLLDLLQDQARSGTIVAVGEIGLDYHWNLGSRTDAIELFESQIAIATEARLPVVVHNREADLDVLQVLRRNRPSGVMHCFSQDAAFCRRCLDLGMHISFGGNLTYKRSEEIREAARIVPGERILVETDAPYLSPEPVRGRPNHPGHLGFTLTALAGLRATEPQTLALAAAENSVSLFAL